VDILGHDDIELKIGKTDHAYPLRHEPNISGAMAQPGAERNSLGYVYMSGEHAPQRTRSPAGLDRKVGAEARLEAEPAVEDHGPDLLLEAPGGDDGREMWRIARDTQVLDVNSPYSYLLWCRDFADSSVVARDGDRVCGFITGYIRPRSAVTLFVWQVAVDQAYRGRGLAKRMLDYLGDRMVAEGRHYLDATVTPDNIPSSRLFEAFARDRGCAVERRTLFTTEQFPRGHQPEVLFRIGPL
jgi:L-2,4-diaminobutyric acid acetyltransferase